ncbi:MAG: response regulator [Elusimicrobia bacterium]|nr:response regulator [Elusimicrobiota bacterium]
MRLKKQTGGSYQRLAPSIKKVFVVDDDMGMRHLYMRLLSRQGHRVTCAGSAEEALAQIGKDDSLIILDVHMPGMNGIALLKALRQKEIFCPVVVISSFVTEVQMEKLKGLGIAGFLTKPFNIAKFTATVGGLWP